MINKTQFLLLLSFLPPRGIRLHGFYFHLSSKKNITQDDLRLNSTEFSSNTLKQTCQNSLNLNSYLTSKVLYESFSNQIKKA